MLRMFAIKLNLNGARQWPRTVSQIGGVRFFTSLYLRVSINRISVLRTDRRSHVRFELARCWALAVCSVTRSTNNDFDTGVYRYAASKTSFEKYFTPTVAQYFARVGVIASLVVLTAVALKKRRDAREHLYRTGQIDYASRPHRFVC
ncbi:uncharacterized protein LOC105838324 isoform X1 [Monomorium pharaonis]|uniref:uncharacterized protein LOC105838324 isoform X1 n=1 Tax=Monomorium pharaonis TaxID=307658 RepID=UPI00063EFFD4|nr:uncharacterized protein LOC105838324 isoform X1 [Monomorium pharaonis]